MKFLLIMWGSLLAVIIYLSVYLSVPTYSYDCSKVEKKLIVDTFNNCSKSASTTSNSCTYNIHELLCEKVKN